MGIAINQAQPSSNYGEPRETSCWWMPWTTNWTSKQNSFVCFVFVFLFYGMFFFVNIFHVTSKVKLTWPVFPFHSWAGNGTLGWVPLDEPPKGYGSLKSFQGGVDPQNLPDGFLWVFTSFGLSFSYGDIVTETPTSRKANLPNLGGGEWSTDQFGQRPWPF